MSEAQLKNGQIADGAVTNAKIAADLPRQNLLVNGGFEVWQRGNGPFSSVGAYSTDRWFLNIVGTDTLSVVRDTVNVDAGSQACAAATFTLGTGAGNTYVGQWQKITTDGMQLRGRTISLSVRVRTATAGAVRLSLNSDSAGQVPVYSTYHTGNGTYQTLTVSLTVNSDATVIYLVIMFSASCTAYLDNAMLVVGSVAADYVPMHPADELLRCQRYYEVLGDPAGSGALIWYLYGGAGTVVGGPVMFKARKAVAPSNTKVGTWGLSNTNQPQLIGGTGQDSLTVYANPTGTGNAQFGNNAAGAYLTSEANP